MTFADVSPRNGTYDLLVRGEKKFINKIGFIAINEIEINMKCFPNLKKLKLIKLLTFKQFLNDMCSSRIVHTVWILIGDTNTK